MQMDYYRTNKTELKKLRYASLLKFHFTRESRIKFKGYKVYSTIHPENAAKDEIGYNKGIYYTTKKWVTKQ